MKANRNSLWQQDDRAQVGIGTMIVFIATILVAATAAAVLIDTSGKLSERSSTTGKEATRQVASNMVVKAVTGERQAGTTAYDIQWLNITIATAPGATAVDVEQMKIQITNGATLKHYAYAAAKSTASDVFQYAFWRDADTSSPSMNAGDMVNVKIDLDDRSFSFAERKDVSILIRPEVGPSVDSSFTTPDSFGTDKFMVLR